MILCPSCQHKNLDGALFCSNCGGQLIFVDEMSTRGFVKDSQLTQEPESNLPTGDVKKTFQTNVPIIVIYLIESGQMLRLSGRTDFTIGRITDEQPILPDIDLAPYGAFAQGVSRLHALIKIVGQNVLLMDLGSSNGTQVNGQKIIAQVEYPLKHGDLIAVGRMRFQVLIR